MKKIFLTFFTFAFLLLPLFAQPSITWSRVYDGPLHYYDIAEDLCESTENTFFIAGTPGGTKGYLMRITHYGDTIWTRTYSGGRILSVCSSGDGGCVFINFPAIKKVDSNGVVLWQGDDTLHMTCNDIIHTTDGGYIACGTFAYNSKVMKFDSLGELIWTKEYSSDYYLSFYRIVQAQNAGYFIAGTDEGLPGIDTTESVLLLIDNNGDTVWQKKHKVFNRPTGASAIELLNNNIILSGTTFDSAQYSDKTRPYFVRLDTAGNVTYSKVFSGARNCERLRDFRILGLNKFVFSTILLPGSNCNYSILAKLYITDSLGNIKTARILSSEYDNIELRKILPLDNGDILFCGQTESSITFDEDLLVI